MVKTIKEEYGKYYAIWLPSTSVHKRAEHVANYGKTFKVSEGLNGEFPGEDYGCKCGLQILESQDSITVDNVAQRGYKKELSQLLLTPKISLRNMILVTLAGTSFLTHKQNIKLSNKLKRAGLQDYKEALVAGGGNIEQRAREVLVGIKLQGKKFNKINAEIENNIIVIPVIVELKQESKAKLIKITTEINTNNKDILLKPDGFYIRQHKQEELETQLLNKLAKKYNTTKLEVVIFGELKA